MCHCDCTYVLLLTQGTTKKDTSTCFIISSLLLMVAARTTLTTRKGPHENSYKALLQKKNKKKNPSYIQNSNLFCRNGEPYATTCCSAELGIAGRTTGAPRKKALLLHLSARSRSMMLTTLGGSMPVACLPGLPQSSMILPSACYFCQRFSFHDAVQCQRALSAFLHGRIVSSQFPVSKGRASAMAWVVGY